MSEHPVFDMDSAEFHDSPLAVSYYNVLNELSIAENAPKGKDAQHRIALWAAWYAHKIDRTNDNLTRGALLSILGLPKTQKAMAEFLGVSDRTLRTYARKYKQYAEMAREQTVRQLLEEYRLPAIHAMGQSAATPAAGHHSDRKMLLTMTGDFKERVDVTSDNERLVSVAEIVRAMREVDEGTDDDNT